MELHNIVGKRIAAVKGYKMRKNQKWIKPSVILFDDGETYIRLDKQDYHTYHDCSPLAREVNVYVNKGEWEHLMASDAYGDANAYL